MRIFYYVTWENDTVYHNDIIAFTETQLNQGISDDEILINGFSGKLFRKDDDRDRYRGICVYYKENLPIKRCSDLEMLLAEGIVTEIVLRWFHTIQFFIQLFFSPLFKTTIGCVNANF